MQIPDCITPECRGKCRGKVPEVDFGNIGKKWKFGGILVTLTKRRQVNERADTKLGSGPNQASRA